MNFLNQVEQDRQLSEVFLALRELISCRSQQSVPPPVESWPSTREVAEYCNITIYIARYRLMKLAEKRKDCVMSQSVSNTLRWYIAETLTPPNLNVTS